MAKAKLVAKVRFDDGSKKGLDGKPTDYDIGEEYKGACAALAKAKSDGLICSESDLAASKEVLDEKDKTIRALEDKLMAANKEIAQLQKDLKEKSGRKPKSDEGDESPAEN